VTGLAPFRAAADRQRARLARMLGEGRASATEIAVTRVAAVRMAELLATAPGSVLIYDRLGPDAMGMSGADRWTVDEINRAGNVVHPHEGTVEEFTRKYQEYLDLSLEILQWGRVRQEVIVDRQRGRQYLIRGPNPLVPRINQVIGQALMEWGRAQPQTRAFLSQPARTGLVMMLGERPDLVALLRMAQTLPLDVEISDVPIDRPGYVEAIELVIGLIPVVGNAIAAYEAWSGEDLFGYRLTDIERGILAAAVLLPVAGRLAKGGRALYTEARLVSLYGRDAAAWSRVLRAGERGAAQPQALGVVERAEHELRVGGSVSATLRREVATAVPALTRGGTTTVGAAVDTGVADLLRDLQQRFPALASLDAPALLRVLERGPNTNHLKGQVLEELVESRLVPWLRGREGAFALGITVPAGKNLEFIPGYLIRDAAGRQVTDGVLAYRDGPRLVIAAVFEAKAGPHAARELSFARGTISGLTQAERNELRAGARDVWRDRREAAQAAGQPFNETVEQVEREFILSERGGQVRRDIERLSPGTDGPARLRIGTEELPVDFAPTRTKFFGVIPRGVRAGTIEGQLAAERVTFEILGVDVTTLQLDEAAAAIVAQAQHLASALP